MHQWPTLPAEGVVQCIPFKHGSPIAYHTPLIMLVYAEATWQKPASNRIIIHLEMSTSIQTRLLGQPSLDPGASCSLHVSPRGLVDLQMCHDCLVPG